MAIPIDNTTLDGLPGIRFTVLLCLAACRHESNPVEVAAVSSNSEYVATGSRNGRIVVVLGQTGAVHAVLKVGVGRCGW
jgi:hypothetical protein